ncbi:2'-5' RNA ligase [Candidatus Daviesbacteria bacterium RIFCSPLOWO2_02_FULL_38_18]|uniref:RNA 2',3'-cyclic phosphodiesterase n=1 Tax=Candidatus Daviesbacteria bacterium GW2011_GWF2_38_6 TaxID=1618432 RepID=A0A0G0KQ96_9BACT|nr:MAG: 2'-5' RNA ligase [Candidatus Daviesbacteria bacterium GW2011_GWF2_38_6]OGE45391.1 MAG: 2'-5' RNA ligase [Candidatus Daviesbacteria bacterium RIFCSPHIGHO2_12_FULL_38_25]OGE68135.1 MAG: 2'-5' RNA ligase [Candidatus Daviesbacteria bacterium RIFCSPLOWO2_02_FULL_38_18]OGE72680.1 MAG: 2'-5' RNA ligase [Candidatus Daviesbacteria bacterium RIFCSPLOWO2_12_FULL_38_10]HCB23386.1 RNA 2',3'-cyclic phosphodiesterase [Candidatus Daviesbacteria bacterium]
MRFFIALEIPKENLLQFQAIQARLHTLIPQARLTDLSKIHLTLAFLGEQPDELKDKLIDIIKKASFQIPPFEITPGYIDGFPSLHKPFVLWIGVKGEIDKLFLIAERIKDELEYLHLSVNERRFVPHISIAKIKNNFHIDKNLEENLEKIAANSFNPIRITSIKLFESAPDGSLHKHNTLAEIKLV